MPRDSVRGIRSGVIAATLSATVVTMGLSACGSLVTMESATADGPRISGLEFLTARPEAGCPVRIKVHLETVADDEMRVGVGWARLDRRSGDSGRGFLRATPTPAGDLVVQIVPTRRGAYAYQVQIGDPDGRWSNVLSARLAVDAASSGEPSRCS